MSVTRRTALVLASIGFILVVPLFSSAAKRRMIPRPEPAEPDGLIYATDPQLRRHLEEAERLIKQKDWKEAVRVLQLVLDAKRDALVERKAKEADSKDATYFISAWALADQLLGTVPARGMVYYGEVYGGRARDLLNKATTTKDRALLAEVARRYRHTEAGVEAQQVLAIDDLGRGQFEMAAVRFKRLLRDADLSLPTEILFKAGIAFRRVGDKVSANRALDLLKTRVNSRKWPRNDPVQTLKRLRAELNKAPLRRQADLKDWPMLGGDPSRSARAVGSAPFLRRRWQFSTVHDQYQGDDEVKHPHTEAWLKMAIASQEKLKLPVLSGSHPVAVNGKLILRSYGAIVAIYIKDGQDNISGKYHAGDMFWKSPMDGALSSILGEFYYKTLLAEWQNFYRMSGFSMVFENSMVGTLSTDGGKVYAVDDLAVAAHPQWQQQWMWGGPPSYPGKMKWLVEENVLRAYAVECGKLLWQLPDRTNIGDLAGTHFLGAPLPIGGKLYVLNEKKSKLQLLCLDQKLLDPVKGNWNVRVVHTHALCGVKTPITQDIVRRMHAVNLAYRDGILVVPTNAGAVLGFDLLRQSLLWSYPYWEKPSVEPMKARRTNYRGRTVFNLLTRTRIKDFKDPEPTTSVPTIRLDSGPAMRPGPLLPAVIVREFKTSPPVVTDGVVVFAAPDAGSIHCVALDQGTRVWQVKRTDDLYLAGVYDGKVLMVGKTGCRALALKDGKQLWAIEVGAPSGRGIATADTYYLPLQKGEICAIDLARGKVKAHIKAPKGEAPGNLIFHDGHLLSQTATHIAAYPRLDVMLGDIKRTLGRNPRDPIALTDRGDLHLANGKTVDAVADLRMALAARPPAEILPRTKRLLFEAFTDLFARDFAAASRAYLKDFEEVCRTDDTEETRRRQSRFHFIVGTGYERQGKLVPAMRSYMAVAELAGAKNVITAPDDPHLRVRAEAWARGRIGAMMKRATPEQRKALDAEIDKRWKELLKPRKKG